MGKNVHIFPEIISWVKDPKKEWFELKKKYYQYVLKVHKMKLIQRNCQPLDINEIHHWFWTEKAGHSSTQCLKSVHKTIKLNCTMKHIQQLPRQFRLNKFLWGRFLLYNNIFFCHLDIDECASSPCMYGTCTDMVHGWQCECDSDLTGDSCDQRKCQKVELLVRNRYFHLIFIALYWFLCMAGVPT